MIKAGVIVGLGVPELFGQVTNLSETGMFIAVKGTVQLNTLCMVRLIIDTDEPAVLLNCLAVRMDDHGVGMQFMEPDSDALEFIRGLLAAYQTD
jgi:hypothetical protein